MHTKILKIRTIKSDRQAKELDLRIMFLTALAVSLEGEKDRELVLIEAASVSDSGCHSGTADTRAFTRGVLQ